MAKSGNMSTRGWKALRNFADGSCGIYALLQAYLILHGASPADAEGAFSANKFGCIRQLVRLCREATVEAGAGLDPTTTFGVPDMAGGAATSTSNPDDLDTPEKWRTAILNVGGDDDPTRGWYDQIAMRAFAEILRITSQVQTVQKISEGDYSWYLAVDQSGPVRASVLILWSGRSHYEVVVRDVSFMLFAKY